MHKREKDLRSSITLKDLFYQVFQDVQSSLRKETAEEILRVSLAEDLSVLAAHLDTLVTNAEFLSQSDPTEIACVRQLEALFAKNASMPGTSNTKRREAAFSKFNLSEDRCRQTNERFSGLFGGRCFPSSLMEDVFDQAKWIIYNLLGPMPDPDELWSRCNFGPGMTFGSSSMEESSLYFKIGGSHTVTAECLPLLRSSSFVRCWPLWVSSLVNEMATYEVVGGNRVTTVPKSAVTDRTIAIEPSFNIFMQKGVESYLTSRLRRSGVDLRSQGRNQHIARIASTKPMWASTIDLASASDTIATELVRYLLPESWFVLLDCLRSHAYTPDKGTSWIRYEKFSSMGNAFTFPLETIIFYAISKACTMLTGGSESRLRVYGDDIIIDSSAFALCVEALDYAGFSTNMDKTFCLGSFRETCGADFINGIDIRPVYLRKVPKTAVEVFTLFNRLLHNRVGHHYDSTLAYLHSKIRRPLYGPPDLGPGDEYGDWYSGKSTVLDGYFHAPVFMVDRFKRFDSDWQCVKFKVLAYKRKRIRFEPDNLNTTYHYLSFLKGLEKGEIYSKIRQPYHLQTTVYSHWGDLDWWPSCYYSSQLNA